MIDVKLSLLSQMSPQLCASDQRNGPEPDGRVQYDLAVLSRVMWMISQQAQPRWQPTGYIRGAFGVVVPFLLRLILQGIQTLAFVTFGL